MYRFASSICALGHKGAPLEWCGRPVFWCFAVAWFTQRLWVLLTVLLLLQEEQRQYRHVVPEEHCSSSLLPRFLTMHTTLIRAGCYALLTDYLCVYDQPSAALRSSRADEYCKVLFCVAHPLRLAYLDDYVSILYVNVLLNHTGVLGTGGRYPAEPCETTRGTFRYGVVRQH